VEAEGLVVLDGDRLRALDAADLVLLRGQDGVVVWEVLVEILTDGADDLLVDVEQ
jgi:hypothetical protein